MADAHFGEGADTGVKVVSGKSEKPLCRVDLVSLYLIVRRILVDSVVSWLSSLEDEIPLVHESVEGEIQLLQFGAIPL